MTFHNDDREGYGILGAVLLLCLMGVIAFLIVGTVVWLVKAIA